MSASSLGLRMSSRISALLLVFPLAVAGDDCRKNTVLSINHLPRQQAHLNNNKSSFDFYGKHTFEDPDLYLDETCTWITARYNILISKYWNHRSRYLQHQHMTSWTWGHRWALTAVHQTGSSCLPSEELNEDKFILIDITSRVTD